MVETKQSFEERLSTNTGDIMKLKYEAIDKACWENNPSMLEDYGWKKGEKISKYYISEYHFTCTNDRMRKKLKQLGWYEYSKGMIYDIDTIDEVRALSDKVQEAYESGEFIPLRKYILLFPYYALTHNVYQLKLKKLFYIFSSRITNKTHVYIKPKWADRFWYDEMDLGGDDDVDYNGTYLDIVFDMIEVAHEQIPKVG